ncbi:MAG: polysulfide reductase NrfD [Elusimicrobia bacterium]|nr:polysulfide reductase NrfD [Elusimicrobiota bacterium]
MLEKALLGGWKYWLWILGLLAVCLIGGLCYLWQFNVGLGITGLGRDVAWGFYIAQFTFLVGVAASAVMVVLPYYLHDYKEFGKITILGECLAVSAIIMCVSFILVDMGQPLRLMNIMLHPTPNSMIFWDVIALNGYLALNALIGYVTLSAERNGVPPPAWIKPIIILSIPWAVSIHTVTAFLYAGLAARPFWLTAVLAPRFLASAFASGPAILILLCMVIKRVSRFDAGSVAVGKLAVIATYAMVVNVFFVLMELFTAIYSGMPEHISHFQYLFAGLGGDATLVPWMRVSVALAVLALALLLNPGTRRREWTLSVACLAIFGSIWIDKGLGMVVTGFIPTPLGRVAKYWPTAPELMISLGVYAAGLLLLTAFYKIVLSVRGETAA